MLRRLSMTVGGGVASQALNDNGGGWIATPADAGSQ
jgi:hypothetical protein